MLLLSERKRLLFKYMNNNGNSYSIDNKDLLVSPLLLIAPPSVLSFMRDYEMVDNFIKGITNTNSNNNFNDYIADSYLPLSSRMFDKYYPIYYYYHHSLFLLLLLPLLSSYHYHHCY